MTIRNDLCLGLAAVAALLVATTASADHNDNETAVNVFAVFQASDDDLMDDGLVANEAEVDAEGGDGEVDVRGLAAAETLEGAVVVVKYRFQEPNKLARSEDKIKIKQEDDLAIELCFCADLAAFDADECTEVEIGAVEGCSGKVKVDVPDAGLPELKLKVKCEDFPSAVAAELDPTQQTQLEDVLGGESDVKIQLDAEATPIL